MFRLPALLFVAAGCAMAQGGGGDRRPMESTVPGTGVYRIGNGVSPPQLIEKVEPKYTEQARQAKYQGTVLLYIEVNPEGQATNIRVQRGLGLGLDENAVKAVSQWKFKPGMKDGAPVTVAATVEVNFRLLSGWTIAWQSYANDADVAKPVLRGHTFPRDCKTPEQATVALDIGSDGAVKDARIVNSSDSALDESVLDAVRRWQFVPAQYKGSPEPVGGQVQLTCQPPR
ncbi:MAG TPA: energy transducer TonB [Bryobacteraceae bacterium]|nr:energy transducer TonB [Bryobacteraceae bacterium]